MNAAPFCAVLDSKTQARYICYTRSRNGVFTICLTDAADVWSTEYTEDTLHQFRQTFALKSTEDYILKLRSACRKGDVCVLVEDNRAVLRVGSGPGELNVSLSQLQGLEAAAQLKELLFRMADSLAQTPDGGSPSVSPLKSHQRRPTGFEPRQQQNAAASATVRKRMLGTSLINPGAKRKLQATGVAFDDADED